MYKTFSYRALQHFHKVLLYLKMLYSGKTVAVNVVVQFFFGLNFFYVSLWLSLWFENFQNKESFQPQHVHVHL